MKLVVQKRIAADIMKCSGKRVKLDPDRLSDVKEAITKADIRSLIKEGAVKKQQKKGVSRVRAKKRQIQRSKGRQRGTGKRKGTAKARAPKKEVWMRKIRLQRTFLKELKEKTLLTTQVYRILYLKAKGGFFRSRNHLKNYIDEHKLFVSKKK
ncbi:50S ribosomal protein L19e [Candidatus Woesearchaeota archaeon]|jgi:large subunit ribosomal protein L19e|nr:50S ribosomal protein L19e [Candidatus Woesearchaeota archaeon]